MSAPLVVSVGMTHPRNIAGIGLDIRVAAEYGVRHAAVVAAVSAQDDSGVQEIAVLDPRFIEKQIGAAGLREAAVVRIGALGSARTFDVLERAICGQQVVVDPVMRSSAGGALYVDDPIPNLRSFSTGAFTIVTPNLEEAQLLTGLAIEDVDDMIAAAKRMVANGADAALVKGGHLPGEPVDVLAGGDALHTFSGTRLERKPRGTGCMLAMALACELALGRDLADAVKGARDYVRANIARL